MKSIKTTESLVRDSENSLITFNVFSIVSATSAGIVVLILHGTLLGVLTALSVGTGLAAIGEACKVRTQ